MNTLYKLFLGEFLLHEEFVHKLLVCLRDRLGHCRAQTRDTVLGRGHLYLGRNALLIIFVCLHGQEVYVSLNGTVLIIRYDYRAYGRTENGLHLRKYSVKVAVLDLHTGDRHHTSLVAFSRELVGFYRTGTYSILAVYGDDNALCGADTLVQTADKIKLTGSVDNVDFDIVPGHIGNRCVYRNFTLDFLRIEIAYCIALGGVSHSVG